MNEEQVSPLAPPDRQDCLSPLLSIVLWVTIHVVVFLRLLIEIFTSLTNPQQANSGWLALPIIQSLVILFLSIPLTIVYWKKRSTDNRYLGFFLAVTISSLYILWMLPSHLTGVTSLHGLQLRQIILSVLYMFLVIWFARAFYARRAGISLIYTKNIIELNNPFILSALSINGLMALPWLAFGALGSLLDSLLAIASGLIFGALAALIVEILIIQPTWQHPEKRLSNFIWGGLMISAVLVILASGLGYAFGVMQLLIIITLLPMAWVWIGLRMLSGGHAPGLELKNLIFPTILVGLCSALPMLFFDANELALIIGLTPGEALSWAFISAFVSFLIGNALAVVLGFALSQNRSLQIRPYLAAIIWLICLATYFTSGQVGFHGEDMLVIMKSQAEMSGVEEFSDPTQKRQMVYRLLVEHAQTSQVNLRQTLDRLHLPYQPYYLVNAIKIPANPLLRLWLETRPEVDRILASPALRPLNQPLPGMTGFSLEGVQPDWNLTEIGAERVWQELDVRGAGILIGQADSGVQWDHPELLDSYRGKEGNHDYNWFDPWNRSATPTDNNGHGTHTLGTIVGNQTGVAPDAAWIACVNLDRNLGNPSYYLECMQFLFAPYPQDGDAFSDGRPEFGALVFNNSWGCPEMEGCDEESLHQAVKALLEAGIFVVASAGNDGPACSTISDPLAIYPQAFTIGAIDSSGLLAEFSSLGPASVEGNLLNKPDLLAPGVSVLSAFPGNTYNRIDGTSMAGPHVAGVVALMWSANPNLIGNIDATEAILRQTAKPYQGELPDCPGATDYPSSATGYGVVDAYTAVKAAISFSN